MQSNQTVKWVLVAAVLFALAVGGYVATTVLPVEASDQMVTLEFDVAEDMNRFVFDEAPVFEDDGYPAYGNAFITQGFIYPKGTLNGSNGVIVDDEGNVLPEFPDKVIGEWTCRGYFVGDAAHAQSGPWVITTQIYNFGEEYGHSTIVTDGYELSDVGVPINRAVTGGTGEYSRITGQAEQIFLGFNASEGVNLTFSLEVEQQAAPKPAS
ncbi:MAG: hypothetical protein R3264_15440 [Anaerolineae bacterium]|nr:hypothetical protein [Anaerolineae bacterium]